MNLVVLSGRVSTDMVLRYTKKGTSVVSFDIAVRKSFTRDAEGNYPTDFFHIVAWNKLAESCQKNLIKGRMVLVKGSLANDDYKDEQGTAHKKTIIKAVMVEFLDSRKIPFAQPAASSDDKNQTVEASTSGNTESSILTSSSYQAPLDIPDEEIPF